MPPPPGKSQPQQHPVRSVFVCKTDDQTPLISISIDMPMCSDMGGNKQKWEENNRSRLFLSLKLFLDLAIEIANRHGRTKAKKSARNMYGGRRQAFCVPGMGLHSCQPSNNKKTKCQPMKRLSRYPFVNHPEYDSKSLSFSFRAHALAVIITIYKCLCECATVKRNNDKPIERVYMQIL